MGSLKLVTTGDKHTKNQIIFDVEGEHFKVKVVGDMDLEEIYTVLVSAVVHLEEMVLGSVAHPESKELH
jgi:hypothetical protein